MRERCECFVGKPVLKKTPVWHWICSECKHLLPDNDLRQSTEIKLDIKQAKTKGHQDSFWYDGDVALLSYKNREVLIIATGEIQIVNKDGELVHDGSKERGPGFPEFKRGLDTDYQLNKLEKLEYERVYNNWFEFFWKQNTWDNWNDMMDNVVYTYDEALEGAENILRDNDWWKEKE